MRANRAALSVLQNAFFITFLCVVAGSETHSESSRKEGFGDMLLCQRDSSLIVQADIRLTRNAKLTQRGCVRWSVPLAI